MASFKEAILIINENLTVCILHNYKTGLLTGDKHPVRID